MILFLITARLQSETRLIKTWLGSLGNRPHIWLLLVFLQAQLKCFGPYDLEIHSNKGKHGWVSSEVIETRECLDARLTNMAYENVQ